LIEDPMAVFVYLTVVVGFIFMLGESKNNFMQKIFHYAPPLIWTYFTPMLSNDICYYSARVVPIWVCFNIHFTGWIITATFIS
ncbi:MAG: hypothetical protein WBV93_05505, partial [Anaerobacillus sp.]